MTTDTPTDGRLAEIERLTRSYADVRDRFSTIIGEIKEERRKAVRSRLPTLRRRVAEVAASKDALARAIGDARDLFAKPRTRALHGIKLGLQKQAGAVEGDEAAAIAAIRRKFPDRVPELVRTKVSLDRTAVRKLSARELASVGLTIRDVDDKIVISAASDDLDRLVDALLDDAEEAGS